MKSMLFPQHYILLTVADTTIVRRHQFSFLEEGFFIEVKQGPYIGDMEKTRIEK